MEFSKLQHNDAHMWERLTRWLCLPCGTAKVNITSSRSQLGGRRLSPQPRLRTGEGCTLGHPGRQVAAAPAGWARSNQGCGGPTGAANICSARTRVAEGEAPLSVRMRVTLRRVETVRLKNTKAIKPLLCPTSNGLHPLGEKILLLCHRCHLY